VDGVFSAKFAIFFQLNLIALLLSVPGSCVVSSLALCALKSDDFSYHLPFSCS
jgi:hypothetical protein